MKPLSRTKLKRTKLPPRMKLVTDETATDVTATAVAAGGMTDVEIRVLGGGRGLSGKRAGSAADGAEQPAMPGARLVFLRKCLRRTACRWRKCGRRWPAALLAVDLSRHPLRALPAAWRRLAACLFDALTALAAVAPSSAGRCRWKGAFPPPSPSSAVVSLLCERADAQPLPRDAARAGRFAPRPPPPWWRDDARARALAACSPPTVPPLLAEPVHAGRWGRPACAPWACRCWRALLCAALDRHGPDRPRLGRACARAAAGK